MLTYLNAGVTNQKPTENVRVVCQPTPIRSSFPPLLFLVIFKF